MKRSRGIGLLALGAAVAFSLVACVSGPSDADRSALQQRAQDVLTSWDAAAASAGPASGLVIVGGSTLMAGGDWGPNIDGGNSKMAMMAGLYEASIELPAETPPAGEVRWSDGSTRAVDVVSAQRAFDEMKAEGAKESSCQECKPLVVTGATLVTATFDTSRGEAQVPAWEFSLKDTPVRMDQVAVAAQIQAPAPLPDGNLPFVPRIMSAVIDPGGLHLTVNIVGAPNPASQGCGADYTAQAVESDRAVVVIVYENRNTLPVPCTAVGALRTAAATLEKPLGDRTVLDVGGLPVSVAPAP